MKTNLYTHFQTWNTDSVGIFDYQKAFVVQTNSNTDLDDNYYCKRQYNNCIDKYDSHSYISKAESFLFRARKNRNNNYEIMNALKKNMKKTKENISKLDNKLWFVIKPENEGVFENNNKLYNLHENDIIKFGRKKYEIIKLNIPSNQSMILENDSLDSINKKYGPIFDISLNPNQFCNKIIKPKNFNMQDVIIENKCISDEKKYNIDPEKNKKSIMSNSISDDKSSSSSDGYNPEKDCRICFISNSTKDNPKLKLCNCHTYIHYNCLKMFLKNRIILSENPNGNVISYTSDKFNCEVCEEPFPLKFRIKYKDNEIKEYCLIDGLDLPDDTNYLILESLTYVKEKKNLKNIFVIKLTDDEVTFGRHEKNDMVDSDITISRYHARIKFNPESGEVNIISKGKYGVLVLIKNSIKMNNDEKVYLQVGKSFVTLEQSEINNGEKGNDEIKKIKEDDDS